MRTRATPSPAGFSWHKRFVVLHRGLDADRQAFVLINTADRVDRRRWRSAQREARVVDIVGCGRGLKFIGRDTDDVIPVGAVVLQSREGTKVITAEQYEEATGGREARRWPCGYAVQKRIGEYFVPDADSPAGITDAVWLVNTPGGGGEHKSNLKLVVPPMRTKKHPHAVPPLPRFHYVATRPIAAPHRFAPSALHSATTLSVRARCHSVVQRVGPPRVHAVRHPFDRVRYAYHRHRSPAPAARRLPPFPAVRLTPHARCACFGVAAFITIALTYFQLAVEDYRWWWRAFLSGRCVLPSAARRAANAC